MKSGGHSERGARLKNIKIKEEYIIAWVRMRYLE
jgi:hypothetical protein